MYTKIIYSLNSLSACQTNLLTKCVQLFLPQGMGWPNCMSDHNTHPHKGTQNTPWDSHTLHHEDRERTNIHWHPLHKCHQSTYQGSGIQILEDGPHILPYSCMGWRHNHQYYHCNRDLPSQLHKNIPSPGKIIEKIFLW